MFKVQKKNGNLEEYDRFKIVNGVVKSGCSPEEAERVASEVELWLSTAAVNNVVQVADLRTKLLEVLTMVNPAAATAFEAYQKPVATEEMPQPPSAPVEESKLGEPEPEIVMPDSSVSETPEPNEEVPEESGSQTV